MAKNTYWLADGYGSKALVEGADERDRWVPRGWAEADEPAGEDRVWMQHGEHKGRAQFPAAVVETWQALGWKPAAPPEPVDVLHDAQLVDVAPDAKEAPASTASDTRAASGTTKEK